MLVAACVMHGCCGDSLCVMWHRDLVAKELGLLVCACVVVTYSIKGSW